MNRKMSIWREKLPNQEILTRDLLNMKIKSHYFHKKYKDWLLNSKRKLNKTIIYLEDFNKLTKWIDLLALFKIRFRDLWMKIHHSMTKWETSKKIWDYQQIKTKKCKDKLMIIREEFKKIINKMNLLKLKLISCQLKIQA